MTLADIPAGTTVFVDANILLFALTKHPVHGAACEVFLDRVENQEITAVTSTHTLGEVVRPRQALDEIAAARVVILAIAPPLVSQATDLSRQTGLLHGDALIVIVMRDQGLSHLASLDADFDRVPGLTRYAPA
jgi:predicted nucleic acid-binding protein